MGVLKRMVDGREFYLESHNLIGRATHCSLVVPTQYASSEHLALDWVDNRWYVRDLGTTNGTFVDNEPVMHRNPKSIEPGQTITVGETEECWCLMDATPPSPMLISMDGNRTVYLIAHGGFVLPSHETPRVSVYPYEDGRWILEHNAHTGIILPNQPFYACENMWRLSVPESWTITACNDRLMRIENTALMFYVSANEETVEFLAETGSVKIWFPNRSQNYLLLTLARELLKGNSNIGWLGRKQLEQMLKIDEYCLNVWIYRLRRAFAEKGYLHAASIIKRRNGALRIGCDRLEVRSLDEK